MTNVVEPLGTPGKNHKAGAKNVPDSKENALTCAYYGTYNKIIIIIVFPSTQWEPCMQSQNVGKSKLPVLTP